jgi:hypothetical protein
MCGVTKSGKSVFAKTIQDSHEDCMAIKRDNCRMYNSEDADTVDKRFYNTVNIALKSHRYVVANDRNINRIERDKFFNNVNCNGCEVICVWVETPQNVAVARKVSGQFDTITMLTDRAQYTKAVQKALEKKWSKIGLTVEQVSVQDISYAKSITNAYADSQAAEVEKAKAQNQQETAKIKGETKVIEATKEAEANRVLNESLTDNVLTQEYIDALKEMSKNGNTVVVPQGSTPVVNTK